MIITKLTGQLGNQMFQYALGKALAEKNKAEFKLDISGFENPYPFWKYTLNHWNIIENPATKSEIMRFKKYNWKKGRLWFWYNRLIASRSYYADERQFHFEPWILTLKDPVYLDGYWQTEKYFKDIEPIIRKEFTLKNQLSDTSLEFLRQIKKENAVSLHVRRGEMASVKRIHEWHGTCSVEYYNEAIRKIGELSANPHFFIFSDDPAWVKKHITPPFPTIYVTGNLEHPEEDLYLMSMCKHHIIANSSFGWWGAWLNPRKDKTVIAPKKWFANAPRNNTKDLIPDSWIKL